MPWMKALRNSASADCHTGLLGCLQMQRLYCAVLADQRDNQLLIQCLPFELCSMDSNSTVLAPATEGFQAWLAAQLV